MITRKSLADLNAGKKDTFDAYRAQLEAAGVAKENIRKEIDATKAAIRRRRAVQKDAGKVEERDALVDEIYAEITASVHAPRTRVEKIEKFDAETGEIIEQIPEAKASEDNGATEPDSKVLADSVTGDASRASVGTDAPKHRVMRMTPLEPRETGGLKGFGFSVHFDDVNSSPTSSPETKADGSLPPEPSAEPFEPPAFLLKPKSMADFRPHCQEPNNCRSYRKDHCHTCKAAAGLVEAAA